MLEINAKLSDLLPVVPYFKRDEQGQVMNNKMGEPLHRLARKGLRFDRKQPLFEVSDDDLVRLQSQARVRECVPEQVPEQVPGQVPGQTCAGVPLLTISNEMDKRENKKERETLGGDRAPAHTCEAEAGESPARQWRDQGGRTPRWQGGRGQHAPTGPDAARPSFLSARTGVPSPWQGFRVLEMAA